MLCVRLSLLTQFSVCLRLQSFTVSFIYLSPLLSSVSLLIVCLVSSSIYLSAPSCRLSFIWAVCLLCFIFIDLSASSCLFSFALYICLCLSPFVSFLLLMHLIILLLLFIAAHSPPENPINPKKGPELSCATPRAPCCSNSSSSKGSSNSSSSSSCRASRLHSPAPHPIF